MANKSIPFHTEEIDWLKTINKKSDDIFENKGMRAMRAACRIAAENGISDMTLDEINTEISEARK